MAATPLTDPVTLLPSPTKQPTAQTTTCGTTCPRAFVDAHAHTAARTKRRGVAFDTPWSIADALAHAMPPPTASATRSVDWWWGDPCVGVGRLVVAAWQRFSADDPAQLPDLALRVRGWDLDADAVAVANDALGIAIRQSAHKCSTSHPGVAKQLRKLADRRPFRVVNACDALAERQGAAWIVTNPPYENMRAQHRRIGAEAVRTLRQRYDLCVGAFDAGVPIVAAILASVGAEWSDSQLGIVAPAAWRSTDYALPIRAALDALGPWNQVDVPARSFDAAVNTWVVTGPAPCGEASADRGDQAEPTRAVTWQIEPRRIAGTVPLGHIATVHGGTPGFEAQRVADALIEGPIDDGWSFVTTRHLRPGRVTSGPTRFMRRTWTLPFLPRDSVSEARAARYDTACVLVPSVSKRLLASHSGPRALGVGVMAVQSEHLAMIEACLNHPYADAWLRESFPGAAMSGGYHRVSVGMLRQLPVPDPNGPAKDVRWDHFTVPNTADDTSANVSVDSLGELNRRIEALTSEAADMHGSPEIA